MAVIDPLRHHKRAGTSHSTFGSDRFGQGAEKFAKFLGTPRYLLGQTLFVILWIVLNGVAVTHGWDPYPFILLNLAFSTQAAYAAPLILLAQTRAADRDKKAEEANALHREDFAGRQAHQLDLNTQLTQQIHDMQTQQMRILALLEGSNSGGLGGDSPVDSGSGGGERGPGPVDVGGAPGLSELPDAPGGAGQPRS
jgi:uncharacterized membrane protein